MRAYPITLLVVLALAAPAAAWDDFLVLTTDYATYGGATRVDRTAPWSADIDAATVSSDAVARWHDGLYYVVNRSGANIQVLDPSQDYTTVHQFSVGMGRNPQDIAFGPDGLAYVSCYDEAVLLQVDPVAGVVTDSWSTAVFADADGLPETAWMQAVGGFLFITCQRLEWWSPAGGSRLLVFDLYAGNWFDVDPGTPAIDGIPLIGQNPSARPVLSPDGRALWVPTTGVWTVDDAGVEVVDLATLRSDGLRLDEATLGGEILAMALVDDGLGWCVVSDADFDTSLKTFDPAGGSVTTELASDGYDYADVVFDGLDRILLCDRTPGAAGLRVFDARTTLELTTEPIAVGRPPFLCVLPEPAEAVSAPTVVPAAPALRAPWPNPANPRVNLAFTARPGETVRIEVRDLRGRRLRTVRVTADGAGAGRWTFDGLDDRGRPLPSGAYRAVAVGAHGRDARGFALVR